MCWSTGNCVFAFLRGFVLFVLVRWFIGRWRGRVALDGGLIYGFLEVGFGVDAGELDGVGGVGGVDDREWDAAGGVEFFEEGAGGGVAGGDIGFEHDDVAIANGFDDVGVVEDFCFDVLAVAAPVGGELDEDDAIGGAGLVESSVAEGLPFEGASGEALLDGGERTDQGDEDLQDCGADDRRHRSLGELDGSNHQIYACRK